MHCVVGIPAACCMAYVVSKSDDPDQQSFGGAFVIGFVCMLFGGVGVAIASLGMEATFFPIGSVVLFVLLLMVCCPKCCH